MIISISRLSPRPLQRSGSAASDTRLLLPCLSVQRLLSTIDLAAMAHSGDWAQTVAMLLAQSLATPDALAGLPWGEGEGRQPARLDLAQTQFLRIFARRWQPGQIGPLHRFMDWFTYGVAAGRLVEFRYAEGQMPGHGDDPMGPVWPGCSSALACGEVRHGPGDGLGLRRLANQSAEVAVSLHVEGLPRRLSPLAAAVMPIAADPLPALRPRPRLTVIPGGRRG